MTAPQVPLKLTLEEGLSLAKKYMVAYLEESSWPDELREKWPEDLDADYRTLFERPVVARDDAAELRAAAEEALEAIGRQQRDPAYHSAYLLLQRAARRLRAALAATEEGELA